MESDKRFGLLRNMLRVFGLSQKAVDGIVNWIANLFSKSGEISRSSPQGRKPELIDRSLLLSSPLAGKNETAPSQAPEFPYRLRDNFLSPAEFSFYEVLRAAVGEHATVNAKVGLSDLFLVKTEHQSRSQIYTNKIDRKHVDFLLCEPKTMRPLVGIELDDKSHQRADRQARDEFVDQVFAAAKLPILHIPARRSYVVAELTAQIAPYLGVAPTVMSTPAPVKAESLVATANVPRCSKCGSQMVLRTAKSGANVGNRFWGCSTYPNCNGVLVYKD